MSGIFAIEGLDATGKSTVINNLEQVGYRVQTTPPDGFKKYRPYFEHSRLNVRFMYYLLGVLSAGKKAQTMSSEEPIFFDRYILTTLTAHEAMGISPKILNLCESIIRRIPSPTNTFLLTCEESERNRRLYSRGANSVDIENLKINDQIAEGYYRWSKKLKHPLMTIDTTYDNADIVTSNIINLIK